MKLSFAFCFLLVSSVIGFAGIRTDVIIESGKSQRVTVGDISFAISVKAVGNILYVNGGGKVDIVRGFGTNDTNRTFIYRGYKCKVYYVDDVGVAPGKVKLAVIAD